MVGQTDDAERLTVGRCGDRLAAPVRSTTATKRLVWPSWFVRGALGGLVLVGSISGSATADPKSYPIGAGDVLQVIVFGEGNASDVLSGHFRVEPDGSIDYPLLGTLSVGGKSTHEVADLLGMSLSEQIPVSPPAVSVAEFAPVYLLGDVPRTGPFQFFPEMTVFDLVLQAGGVSQPDDLESREASVLKDLAGFELTNFSLLVQRARLQAEIAGETFDNAAFLENASDEQLKIITSERAIFQSHERRRMSRRANYTAQREGYDQEISFVQQGTAYHDEELRLVEEQVNVQAGLADRGLAARSQLRGLQRQLASTRREALEFRTALFRAKQNRLSVDQSHQEAEIADETTNTEALRDVELNLLRNEIELRASSEALAKIQRHNGATDNALGRMPVYHLVRRVDGSYSSGVVNGLAQLQRGDIVRVEVESTTVTSQGAVPAPRDITELQN